MSLHKRYTEIEAAYNRICKEVFDHYYVVIDNLRKDKDIEGLKRMISEVPDETHTKLFIYQSIREIKDGVK